MIFFEMFQFPFMQRAFIAGIILAVVLAWLGVFVTTRKMSFAGDGIAHASLAAVAVAILFGWAPLPTALLFSLVLGAILFYMNRYTTLSTDSAIGIVFTTGMALGVVLLQYHEGYAPELISYLFGSILGISQRDLLITVLVSLVLLVLLFLRRKQFAFLAIDEDGASLAGVSVWKTDFLFYLMVPLAIVLGIKLVGVILVSALLIVPSVSARQLAYSFASLEVYSICIGVITMVVGLVASYILDWPSGASIILVGTLFFVLSHGMQMIRS